MRHWLRVLLVAILLLGLATSPGGTEPDPILVIHGFGSNSGTFSELQLWLRLSGRTVVALDLPAQDNRVNAQFIKDAIAHLGWNRVDLLMHSMGGLSGRYYVKPLGGASVVQAYVSLGTPQYGVDAACEFDVPLGGQMCPTGDFLTSLNHGDDTPAGPAWATIYSDGDRAVPADRSRLDGGACHFEVVGLGHVGLLHSPDVTFPLILAALDDNADAICPRGGLYRP